MKPLSNKSWHHYFWLKDMCTLMMVIRLVRLTISRVRKTFNLGNLKGLQAVQLVKKILHTGDTLSLDVCG